MIKAGIVGGGQLGRMLLQAAANYPVQMHVLENDADCPAAAYCKHFTKGNITNYEDVYAFGKSLDVITIEIENINIEALEKLETEGKLIVPNVAALKIIRDKSLQKEFYKKQEIPTSDFVITHSSQDVLQYKDFWPAVHKLATGGYDGKGVVMIDDANNLQAAFNEKAVLEKKVTVTKEIAITVAITQSGETCMYSPVEMVFDQRLNLLDHQISPASLPEKVFWKTEAIAMKLAKNLNSPGLFAIEMFVDDEENVWVNETAPRVHNSGHHSIEACYSSQFDMLMRIMLGYPAGNTQNRSASALINIIGEKEQDGTAFYQGLEEILKMDNAFVHIYGKQQTKPGRKMGHVTVISNEKQELIHKVNQVKERLKVITKQ